MITVTDAVRRATDFAQSVLEVTRARDLLLEEVVLEDQPPRWLITLSMPATDGLRLQRVYKTFTLDAETGAVQSMRIRELAGAS
jgi:hypothetical protein